MVAALADSPPGPRRSSSAPADPHGLRSWLSHVHPNPWGWYVVWDRPDDAKIGTFTPFQGHELDKAISFIERKRKAGHVYVSLGTQAARPPRGKRGMSTDVTSIAVIWADIDTGEGVHAKPNLPPTTQDAMNLISHLPPPSFVLHTGGGIQPYWYLHRDHPTETTNVVEAVEAVQWSIQQQASKYGWHVDQLSDAARVFRAPGTLNHKHQPPRPARTLTNVERTYSLDDFADELAAYNADATVHIHRAARRTTEHTASKYPSVAAYNADHDIAAELERVGYLWDGRRMRHPDSSRKHAAGVVIDAGKNVAYIWDLDDPLHHGRGACACATPFQVHVTFDHGGNFAHAMNDIRAAGWIDEPAYQLPVHTHVEARHITTAVHELPDARGIIIKSPIGTGKTELLKRRLAAESSVLVVGHRRNLLRNMAERLGLTYYEDVVNGTDEDQADLTDCTRLAICLDSIEKLSTRQQFDYVILDESEQILQHATGSTVKPKRSGVLEYLRHFQTTAGQVIYLDADAGRITHGYASRVLGADQLHTIVNTARPADKTFVAYDLEAELKAALFEAIRSGQKVAVAANSIKMVKNLIQSIGLEYPEVRAFGIHGENSAEAEVQEFIQYINERVRDVDVLVYSPSLGTGVSIDTVHFDAVFVFGHGQPTTHRDMLQQAGRVRHPKTKTVHCWISSQRHDKPTAIALLKEQCVRNATETGLLIGIDAAGEMYSKDDEYLALWADVESERNRSLNNLRDQFYAAAHADGHRLVHADDVTQAELAEAREIYNAGKELVFAQHVQQLRTVTPLAGYEAKELRQKQTHTAEEMAQLKQYDLCQFYEIEPADITEVLVKADDAGLRRNAARLAMLLSPEAAAAADELERHALLPDKANYQLQAKLRREILKHIQFVQEPEKGGVTTGAMINMRSRTVTIPPTFAAIIQGQRAQIWSLLGLTVNKDIDLKPMQFVSAFLGQLGLKMTSKQHRVGLGKRVRIYALDEAAATEARRWADRWLALHPTVQQTELEAHDVDSY
jgi:hypothetical protein